MKKIKTIAFQFVIDQLYSLDPIVKPMFGCHAIYVQNKIVLMLRKKDTHEHDNGIWVAIAPEHHGALKKRFPSLRPVQLLGGSVTAWQNLPDESDSFEEDVLAVCDLILKKDPRIGKIPKAKKKKTSKS